MKKSDIDLGIGLWRELERQGIRPTPNLMIRLLAVLGVHCRRQDIYRVFAPFRNVHDTQREQHGNTNSRSAEHSRNKAGTDRERSSCARGKGITSDKASEEVNLFGEAADEGTPTTPRKAAKARDLAVYKLIDGIWSELQPTLPVPIAKTEWRKRNITSAEKLLAALGSPDAVLEAWRQSSALHGETSITLARVADDLNFRRIGPQARSPATKEKTALQRGFPDPENFTPEVFELESS